MEEMPASVRRALRRSRIQRDLLLALAEQGSTYPQDLADRVRVDGSRLRDALYGRAPHYKRKTSPVALRLVRVRRDRHGEVVGVTARGVEAAAYLRRRGGRA